MYKTFFNDTNSYFSKYNKLTLKLTIHAKFTLKNFQRTKDFFIDTNIQKKTQN